MKLVEILAKEMSKWPSGFNDVGQAFAGELHLPGIGEHVRHTKEKYTRSEDWGTAIVTHAQWQAERDRQKGGVWKRHRGGAQPKSVSDSNMVEVRLRCGDTQTSRAGNFLWNHADCDESVNITKYRVISQPQAEEVEESADKKQYEPAEAPDTREYKGPFPCAPAGEPITELEWDIQFQQGVFHMEAKTGQIDGPIKWRDTVNELDAYIEEFAREREALINRLALEGFALIPAMTAVMGVADVDMGDWRNWEIGDHLEIFDEKEGHEFKVGQIVKVTGFDGSDEDLPVKASSLNDDEWWFVNNLEAKFIRRP